MLRTALDVYLKKRTTGLSRTATLHKHVTLTHALLTFYVYKVRMIYFEHINTKVASFKERLEANPTDEAASFLLELTEMSMKPRLKGAQATSHTNQV